MKFRAKCIDGVYFSQVKTGFFSSWKTIQIDFDHHKLHLVKNGDELQGFTDLNSAIELAHLYLKFHNARYIIDRDSQIDFKKGAASVKA